MMSARHKLRSFTGHRLRGRASLNYAIVSARITGIFATPAWLRLAIPVDWPEQSSRSLVLPPTRQIMAWSAGF